MLAIEVRDKYNGAMNDHVACEVRKCLDDIVDCPRETLRFFHRRNSCSCLKEIYYKLKDSMKRTAECWSCSQNVDIRKVRTDATDATFYNSVHMNVQWLIGQGTGRNAKKFQNK
eukprot:scaffold4760_cov54-Cyclotella_meneghiniana.AAC.4